MLTFYIRHILSKFSTYRIQKLIGKWTTLQIHAFNFCLRNCTRILTVCEERYGSIHAKHVTLAFPCNTCISHLRLFKAHLTNARCTLRLAKGKVLHVKHIFLKICMTLFKSTIIIYKLVLKMYHHKCGNKQGITNKHVFSRDNYRLFSHNITM